MQEYKNKIEAVLFTVGKFMSIDELSEACGIASKGIIKQALEELKKDYELKNTSLTLEEKDNKFKLNIKKEYIHLTSSLLSISEFNKQIQKTLAIIAYKNPALQSDIIHIRGNKAYDHISFLKEQNLITTEKHSRTKLLKLTTEFYDYFDISEEDLKTKLDKIKLDEKLEKGIQEMNLEKQETGEN